MTHLFISPLQAPLASWHQAFPALTLLPDVVSAEAAGHSIIWVHAQPEQGTQWRQQVQRVLSLLPAAKVIVLSNTPEQAEAMLALQSGAVGYLHAYAHAQVLKEVSKVIAQGGVWLGRELLKHLITLSTARAQPPQAAAETLLEALTPREREVALEAARGQSNKEIARVLSISERTVKAHLTSVFETLKVRDRLHLALVLQGQSQQGHFSMAEDLLSIPVTQRGLHA